MQKEALNCACTCATCKKSTISCLFMKCGCSGDQSGWQFWELHSELRHFSKLVGFPNILSGFGTVTVWDESVLTLVNKPVMLVATIFLKKVF